MDYKGFYIRVFERDPGKWRASIHLINRTPRNGSRKKPEALITVSDTKTAAAAVMTAMAAIDAGPLSYRRRANKPFEKFWRLIGPQAKGHSLGAADRGERNEAAGAVSQGP